MSWKPMDMTGSSTPVSDLPGVLSDLEVIRKDFPILSRTFDDDIPLVYLDSANTSHKPQVVIDTMVDHLEQHNANIARALVVGDGAVEKHIRNIFAKLVLPPDDEQHRRVLAVLAYLRS